MSEKCVSWQAWKAGVRTREGYPENAQPGITKMSLAIKEFSVALKRNSEVC